MSLKSRFKDLLFFGLNLGGFYVGWFACIDSAISGRGWTGPAVVFFILGLQLLLVERKGPDIGNILIAILLGTALDSLYQKLGLIVYKTPNTLFPELAPLWLISLYALFGSTLIHSLSWLQRRPLLGALLGGAGGAFCYATGAKFGAIILADPPPTLGLLGLIWAFFVPFLFAIHFRPKAPTPPADTPPLNDSTLPVVEEGTALAELEE